MKLENFRKTSLLLRPEFRIGRRGLIAICGLSCLAFIVVAVQVSRIYLQGEILCPNDSCFALEQLTTIPPLMFNALGLGYFLVLFFLACLARREDSGQDLLLVWLFVGMSTEGVLFSYQFHVAKVFCSYCLLIFGFIVLLNLAAGIKQFFKGAMATAAIFGAFSCLSFTPASLLGKGGGLDEGSAVIVHRQENADKLYLLFSRDCPHCSSVLSRLPEYSRCEIHLNPIDRLDTIPPRPKEEIQPYLHEINRLFLAMLQLDSVPILYVRKKDSAQLIKGDKNIISFLDTHCQGGDSEKSGSVDDIPAATGESPIFTSMPDSEAQECTLQNNCSETPPGWPGTKQ